MKDNEKTRIQKEKLDTVNAMTGILASLCVYMMLYSSLIGGILMSANGKRIDASMTSQLEAARNVLKQSTDGGEC